MLNNFVCCWGRKRDLKPHALSIFVSVEFLVDVCAHLKGEN